MIKASLAALAVALVFPAHAQTTANDEKLVAEVKSIDKAELAAFLKKDIPALEKYWAEDLTVNAPNNRLLKKKDVLDLLRTGFIDYASYERQVDAVLVHGDTVIVMGSETLTRKTAPAAPVHRRATNIWMKQKGKWQLIARHANVICSN